MSLYRSNDRSAESLREIKIETGFYDYAEGSALISYGSTKVLCVATVESFVPPHIKGTGKGWISAEYNMLPRSSPERIRRERSNVGGRTQEIQRLVGRCMRSCFSLEGWGERSMILDCDVLQADGGTRTASITGAFIAAVQAFRHLKNSGAIDKNALFPTQEYMSAVSVGIVGDSLVLDLDYPEDSTAQTDMNLVATSHGKIVEVQGTAEKAPMGQEEFQKLLDLGLKGCQQLCEMQRSILGDLSWTS